MPGKQSLRNASGMLGSGSLKFPLLKKALPPARSSETLRVCLKANQTVKYPEQVLTFTFKTLHAVWKN